MLKERSQSFKLVFILLDLSTSIFSFFLAFIFREVFFETVFYYSLTGYIILGCVLSVSQILAFVSIELYHPRRGLSYIDEFIAISSGIIVNLFFILSMLFFIREESFSRAVVLNYILINIVVTSISHFIFRKILKAMRKKGYNLRYVLILGTGNTAFKLSDIFQKHQIYGYVIAGYVTTTYNNSEDIKVPKEKIVGNINDLETIIQKVSPDIVVSAFSNQQNYMLRKVVDICDYEGIDLKIVPDYMEFLTVKGRVDSLDGVPIISIRDIPIRLGYNKFIKRSFDLFFAIFFILVFSPFYIILSLIIKLTSKGPIFILQERVGLDNKEFKMYKFRTMYVQEKKDSDTLWTVKNDPRVTPIGSILRKYSIDETPQFFNVLFGDMSVVGPRPERPFYVEKFRNEYKQYMRRHAVKSGITGWAQVNGLRGDTSIEARIEADIFYIENWSFLFDLKIILLTPFKAILDKNAY
jgi:Undecaprenyl-phosphate glucose phosphotransferase